MPAQSGPALAAKSQGPVRRKSPQVEGRASSAANGSGCACFGRRQVGSSCAPAAHMACHMASACADQRMTSTRQPFLRGVHMRSMFRACSTRTPQQPGGWPPAHQGRGQQRRRLVLRGRTAAAAAGWPAGGGSRGSSGFVGTAQGLGGRPSGTRSPRKAPWQTPANAPAPWRSQPTH